MQHASLPSEERNDGEHEDERDPQLISGMFIAIQNFVRESFVDGAQDEELNRMRVGQTDVLIESSPTAVLAACVKGTPPANFREQMLETLEKLGQHHHEALDEFNGDPESAKETLPQLEILLADRRRESRQHSRYVTWGALAAAAAIILTILGINMTEHRRWNQLLEDLNAVEGVQVVTAEKSWSGGSIEPDFPAAPCQYEA